jgi:cell fate regulator YaaT (PSP1 superfamily)
MGCGSGCGCGTDSNGKVSGCKSNGGCSSGGCNRLNTHNWMASLPSADFGKMYPIVEISFNKGSRKDFYKNNTVHLFEKGDFVSVEGVGGWDVGAVSLTGELVKLQMAKKGVKETSDDIKKIIAHATPEQVAKMDESKSKEKEMLIRARAAAVQLNLGMKITEVELQADGKKATFFYIAEDRVDFRELIKIYASDFRVKVEMKQIGIRQEAAKVGGIGSCGRELCCSTWLTDFKGVSTVAARYQNLSINQTKLSGQCGRLKCCLNFELDTYMDALKDFPDNCDKLELANGMAFLQKKDIFKYVMWYTLAGSNKPYPIAIERALEIKALNQKGQRPDDLGVIELESPLKGLEAEVDIATNDLVGAISLRSLDKANRKGRNQKQGNNRNNSGGKGGNANAPRPNNTNQQAQQSKETGANVTAKSNNTPNAPKGNNTPNQGNRPNTNNKAKQASQAPKQNTSSNKPNNPSPNKATGKETPKPINKTTQSGGGIQFNAKPNTDKGSSEPNK